MSPECSKVLWIVWIVLVLGVHEVSMSFDNVMDAAKDFHWISPIEHQLARLSVEAIEIANP